MSKKYPECPLYNHSNCKELDNPKVCVKKNPRHGQKIERVPTQEW
jgi:hypothetical protein